MKYSKRLFKMIFPHEKRLLEGQPLKLAQKQLKPGSYKERKTRKKKNQKQPFAAAGQLSVFKITQNSH